MPGLRVRASAGKETGTLVGFYGNQRRKEGDEFVLDDPKHYSFKWMEPLDFDPEKDYKLVPPSGAYETFVPTEAPGAVLTPESESAKKNRLTRSQRQILRRSQKKAVEAGAAPKLTRRKPASESPEGESNGQETTEGGETQGS